MHILFLTDNFPPEVNAVATRVFERARYWIKWGHQVTIITSVPNMPQGKVYAGYKNKWYQEEVMEGIRVIRVKTFIAANKGFLLRTLDFMSYIVPAFFASLRVKQPDIVTCTSPQFFVAVTAWLVSCAKRKPYILELGDLWPASITAVGAMKDSRVIHWLERLELFLYRQAKAIVLVTEAFKNNLISRGINAQKLFVARNGVELSTYSPQKKNQELLSQYGLSDKYVMTYIGTHGPAQELSRVLDAAATLQSVCPKVHFLFVGDGAMKASLLQQSERLKLSNVTFVPPQPKSSMPEYWALGDVALVHLKHHNTFSEVIPSKMFEVMGMGLPILFSGPKGEASDILEKTGAALCVLVDDQAAFVQAVSSLVEDKCLRERCAALALEAAPQHSRENQARQVLDVYKTVLGG